MSPVQPAGSGRLVQRERLGFDRVGRRVVGLAAAKIIVNVVRYGRPRRGVFAIARAASGNRDKLCRRRQARTRPAGEGVAGLGRIVQCECRGRHLVCLRIHRGKGAARKIIGDGVFHDLPVCGVGALARAALGNRDRQLRVVAVGTRPAGERIAVPSRRVQRECIGLDGVRSRVRRFAAVQFIIDLIRNDVPVRGEVHCAGAAFVDQHAHLRRVAVGAGPAGERIACLDRIVQREGRRFGRVGRRVVGRTAVQIVCDRIACRRPCCNIAAVAGASGRDDDCHGRLGKTGTGPAGEVIAVLDRVVQRDGRAGDGVESGVRDALRQRTAVERYVGRNRRRSVNKRSPSGNCYIRDEAACAG